MASESGERGRAPDTDWEARERSNSPTSLMIRGANSANLPAAIGAPSEAYTHESSASHCPTCSCLSALFPNMSEDPALRAAQTSIPAEPPTPVIPAPLQEDIDPAQRQKWEAEWERMPHYGPESRKKYFDLEASKYIDNPADIVQYKHKYSMPTRPGFNSTGQEVDVAVNMHMVNKYPNTSVHQFDITITGGTGAEKRGLIRAIWESNTRKKEIGGKGWIWNGDKIAWSDVGIAPLAAQRIPPERHSIHFEVDLDQERGQTQAAADRARAPRGEDQKIRSNKFMVQVRFVKSINLASIWGYLTNHMDWNDTVTESVTLLNHILREMPSKNLTAFKNSFFPKKSPNQYELLGGVYALKGVFQSVRMTNGFTAAIKNRSLKLDAALRGQNVPGQLMLNVDVSHACFYKPQRVDHIAMQILEVPDIGAVLSLVQKSQRDPPYGVYHDSPALLRLKSYLRKLSFTVKYPGVTEKTASRRWIIKGISYDTARSRTFQYRDRESGETKTMSVQQYFQKIYGVRLEHASLPLIECTKKDVFYPMELCVLEDGQRYAFKLSERQTSDMIKFAVARPPQRKAAIQEGIKNLNWAEDPCLQHFGIRVNPQMVETKARLLVAPKVAFANNKVEQPGTSGRWRIDSKKFYVTNKKPIEYWGVCIIDAGRGRDYVSDQEANAFVKNLVSIYQGHGGQFINASPATCRASETDTANAVDRLVEAMRTKKGLSEHKYPDLMVFILPRKNTENYQRLKRCADLKWGSISQCVQAAHVKRNSPQYHSNVCMKINAKLGGSSFKAVPVAGPIASTGKYFSRPTMVIGADVSHPSPGSLAGSQAALSVSMDREGIRYGAAVQSNGHRLEMITTWNWNDMLGPMAREWITSVGAGRFPEHIYYFRDGVSEGQYEHVIQQEVRDIRNVFKQLDPSKDGQNLANLKFTVIIASKHHHIRLFPKPGPGADKNGNACPGIIIEKDVTGFKDYDFYLCSHSAIQGTARPTHYTVIMDQANVKPNELQNMIYEQCYQYIRSSTPVSIHPAVYYAHLASRRAVAHERTGKPFAGHRSSEQRERYLLLRARAEADQTGKIMTQEAIKRLQEFTLLEYPPNIPTCNNSLWHGMWFI